MKNLIIAFVIVLMVPQAANCQTASQNQNQVVSAGYWLFGDASGTFHNAFLRYETLVFQKKLDISLTPHIGLNRKSFGGALGLKFVAASKRKTNFLIGNEFHTWVQDDFYHEDQLNPATNEVHQTTKGAIYIDVGIRTSIQRLSLTGMFKLGNTVFNSYEKKAGRMNPPLKGSMDITGGLVTGVNIGVGYKF